LHTIFVNTDKTADFQITRGIPNILANQGNRDGLVGFMFEKSFPIEEIEAGL